MDSAAVATSEVSVEVAARVRNELEAQRTRLLAFSHALHANPELGYQEIKASAWLADELRSVPGSRVEHGLESFPTAVRAEVGTGELVVTLCAEYDALPGVGHACGHNIIAASALGTFLALAPLADELGITIRLLGTPAEEAGGGKVDLLRLGSFDGTHIALMVHPSNADLATMNTKACTGYQVAYSGRSAHASLAPWEGVNALDAMTVAMTAIGLVRQQLKPDQQIHGVLLEGGQAPNVVPDQANGVWMARANTLESLKEVCAMLTRCFEAGALATGADLDLVRVGNPYSEMNSDEFASRLYMKHARALGRDVVYTDGVVAGSTDMANVSLYFPAIHPTIGLGADAPPIHSPAFAEYAGSPAGDSAIIDGATAMALAVVELASDPSQRARLIERTAPSTASAGLELDD